MQKTLSSSQLKEIFAVQDEVDNGLKEDDQVQNHEDVELEMKNKNDQPLNAEVIEKYFAENSEDKFVDDEDSDEREDDDGADQPFYKYNKEELTSNPYENSSKTLTIRGNAENIFGINPNSSENDKYANFDDLEDEDDRDEEFEEAIERDSTPNSTL